MHGTIPGEEDQRTLLKAGNYVDSRFHMLLQEHVKDSPVTLEMSRRIKEQYAFVSSNKEVIAVDFQVEGKPRTYDVTESLREACESVLPDLVASARELIISFDPEFQHELRQNILVAGGGSQIRGLGEEIRSNLSEFGNCKVTVVDDPIYSGAVGALTVRGGHAGIRMAPLLHKFGITEPHAGPSPWDCRSIPLPVRPKYLGSK